MSIEIKHEGRVIHTSLPRALFRDSRLTFGARGLFAFLWDLPSGWHIRLEHLATVGPEGRDAIRSRLRELQSFGGIRIEAVRKDKDGNPIPGGRVAGKRWILISPERWAIESPLSRERNQDSDSTEKRVFRTSEKSPSSAKPMMGKSNTKVLQGLRNVQIEAAAPHAHACGTSPSAAASSEKRKHPRRTKNGIECWYPVEDDQADEIEMKFSDEHIAAAVRVIRSRKNRADKPTSPVPVLVEGELMRQKCEREKAAAAADKIAADAAHAETARKRAEMGDELLCQIPSGQRHDLEQEFFDSLPSGQKNYFRQADRRNSNSFQIRFRSWLLQRFENSELLEFS